MTANTLVQEQSYEALQTSHRFVEALFDCVPEAIVVSDAGGCVLRVNGRMEKLFGYTRAELLGQPVEMLIPERFRRGDLKGRQHYQQDPWRGAMGASFAPCGKHKGGREFLIDALLSSIETEQGRVILSLIRDVTECDTGVGLRFHLAALVNSSGDAIIGKTLDGAISSWNQSAERIFGYSAAEAIGQPISILLPSGTADEDANVVDILKRGETTHAHDTVRRRKDGQNIDVSVVFSPIYDPLGNLVGASKVVRDITERKQLETELETRRAQAVASAHLSELGMMAGSIAHEINNPLAVIHASASDLLEMAETGNVMLEALQLNSTRIKRTADRISKIVKSLRQIARKGLGDPFERASVSEIVDEVLELCRERFRVHSVRLDTPVVDPGLQVLCREVQIAQVLLNLLLNAFDAVIGNESNRWVRLEATSGSEYVVFAVIDSGPGIAPEIKARIMEPFFTTKAVGKGTGLGLSLSKAIVEEHGGELTVGERDNHTCFSFLLPHFKEPECS